MVCWIVETSVFLLSDFFAAAAAAAAVCVKRPLSIEAKQSASYLAVLLSQGRGVVFFSRRSRCQQQQQKRKIRAVAQTVLVVVRTERSSKIFTSRHLTSIPSTTVRNQSQSTRSL